jgi:hypothetical protein
MPSKRRVNRAEFGHCVSLLRHKLETMAIKAGVPESEETDLESLLASLPPFYRDRAAVMLQGITVQAEEEFPAMAFSARYVLSLARDVWDTSPVPVPAFAGAEGSGSMPD